MKKRIVWTIILSVLTWYAVAAVYKRVNPDGSVTFSNQPIQNGEKIKLPPANVSTPSNQPAPQESPPVVSQPQDSINPVQPSDQASPKEPQTPAVVGYKSAVIASPQDQQTFWNQRQISVEVKLDPKLQIGDSVQLYVDGNTMGSPEATTTFTVNNLDRGEHSLQARVINSNNQVMISTDTIAIFIHYGTVNQGEITHGRQSIFSNDSRQRRIRFTSISG